MARKAKIDANDRKTVTITIAEKGAAPEQSDVEAYQEAASDTVTIPLGDKILTITIAE